MNQHAKFHSAMIGCLGGGGAVLPSILGDWAPRRLKYANEGTL